MNQYNKFISIMSIFMDHQSKSKSKSKEKLGETSRNNCPSLWIIKYLKNIQKLNFRRYGLILLLPTGLIITDIY